MSRVLRALALSPVLAVAMPLAAEEPLSVEQVQVAGAGHAPITLVIWHLSGSAEDQSVRLVVMSHGTGASPLSHRDTAEALARAGFVVAAPMHPGDNFQDQSSVGQARWMADRSRDLSLVIDYMHAQWAARDTLAPEVGVFGFSAGATTALIVAGGNLDFSGIASHCAETPEFVCQFMAPPAAATVPGLTHDARIDSAVVAAPGLGFAFAPDGLVDVSVPIQLWVASADEAVPFESNAGIVQTLLPGPVEFISVEGAGHLSFLAPCTADSPPLLCEDPAGFDRTAFHDQFNSAVVDFFQRTLAQTGP